MKILHMRWEQVLSQILAGKKLDTFLGIEKATPKVKTKASRIQALSAKNLAQKKMETEEMIADFEKKRKTRTEFKWQIWE